MFKFTHERGCYRGKISNLNPDSAILITFDTGAIRTVISLKTLFPDVEVDANEFKRRVSDEVRSQSFFSASGNEITGYLVQTSNVNLTGYKLKYFYYYLVVDLDRPLALLGDDFISYCRFHHDKMSDIIVSGFDEKSYIQEAGKAITRAELGELLGLEEIR